MTEEVLFYADQQLELGEMTVKVISSGGENPWVVRGWLREDFAVGIQNNWNSGDSTIMKQIVDGAAKFITSRDAKTYTEIASKGLGMAKGLVSSGSKGHAMITELQGMVNKAGAYTNSHIFSADDFYKSFKGTNINIPSNITITLITDALDRDVYEDVNRLFGASIGEFQSPLSGFVGIQLPPNGFRSTTNNLKDGVQIPGTLNMEVGNNEKGGFRLTNLVINSVNLVASTTKVKLSNGQYRPLYIDVSVGLEPARKYTPDDMRNMFKIAKKA